MTVTFLHIADIHLDTPFKTIAHHNQQLMRQMAKATRQSFERLIDVAISESVDFVCIVGDSFNGHEPSVSSQLFFQKQLERLQEKQIPVYLTFGNHDYQQGQLSIDLPENVHVFLKDVSTYTVQTRYHETVAISGFSYHTRHIHDEMITQFPFKQATDFHIGLWHGSLSSQSSEYAPFQLAQLSAKQYDYWALGHIHKREIIQQHPPVAYAGSPQGLNRNETGDKGGYLVCLEKGKTAVVTPINTASILWHHVVLEGDQTTTLSQYIVQLTCSTEQLHAQQYHLCSFTIRWDNQVPSWVKDMTQSDYAEQLPSHIVAYRVRHEIKQPKTAWLLDDKQQRVLQRMMQSGFDRTTHQQAVALLWQNPIVKAQFGELFDDDDFYQDMMAQALQQLQQEGSL